MIFEAMPPERYEELKTFYKQNSSHFVPYSEPDPNVTYFGVFSGGTLIGVTGYSVLTEPYLVMMQSTVIHKLFIGKGFGRYLNQKLEEHLESEGYGKIVSHIYVDNLPSIILKLKLGYRIEGHLKDHDREGQDEYILGKVLK